MNVKNSLEWIQILYQQGVREFCLCPGGRNAPLVKALNLIKGIRVYFFYDERAAGFFALGCSKRSARPTAVVTTSGTAVANLLPATIESYYSGIPLVLVTADRPKSYRGSGAPQSIEQIGIFSHYVGKTVDFEVNAVNSAGSESEYLELGNLAIDKPTHINLCFDEPLLSDWKEIENNYSTGYEITNQLDLAGVTEAVSSQEVNFEILNQIEMHDPFEMPEKIKKFGSQNFRPMVLLGPGPQPKFVEAILLKWNLPIYAEAGSSLREKSSLSHLMLRGGTQAFQKMETFQKIDSVIRIGQVPTCRLWRDLEYDLKTWPVLNFSDLPFSGLSRIQESPFPFSHLQKMGLTSCWLAGEVENLVNESWAHQDVLDNQLLSHPYSEEAWFRKLSEWIPEGSQVFLGNSLPIREWDVAATLKDKNLAIQCNRGANGIDGLVSTALGWSNASQPTFAIIGDLSCLYDMNALQILKQIKTQFHLVVINNGGGKIFSSMFEDKNFENRHSHSFHSLAEMFGLDYHYVVKELPTPLISESSLIEIVPC